MIVPGMPQQNHLLASLPMAEWGRLSEKMELHPMPLGHVLYESGDTMRHVYFPTTSIVSLLYVMENGASAEIAIVVWVTGPLSPGLESRIDTFVFDGRY